MVIKPSNIRIWIHDKDIDKLMRVVLEGHGHKLRNEVANQPKVKRFLEYVPHFLGLIKSIHQAVIDNNIEYLRAKTSPPVPPQMLSCKDVNGLTPLHKAAGLAHTKIVEYLLAVWPNASLELDNSGKNPLHYAASVKNNERVFNLLVQAGSDELATDQVSRLERILVFKELLRHHQQKGHPPAFYKKNKPTDDIDRSLLVVVPDAPRIAEQGFPPGFDWKFLPAKFFNGKMKPASSEFNLSSNAMVNGNGMKPSVSSFEIVSRSHSNLNEADVGGEKQEVVVRKSAKKIGRPKTFK